MGRLSNPSDATKTLVLHRSTKICKPLSQTRETVTGPPDQVCVDLSEDEGRLSNPVKRRLTEGEIVQLVEDYVSGHSVNEVARPHGIHRTTVMNRLESRGVQRRRILRKLSSIDVVSAARLYANGSSLAVVAKEFGVSQKTITSEFRAAGIRIRPRRGWADRVGP